ncbi:MAG: FliH/SctL family protein [Myxococcota bacterium]
MSDQGPMAVRPLFGASSVSRAAVTSAPRFLDAAAFAKGPVRVTVPGSMRTAEDLSPDEELMEPLSAIAPVEEEEEEVSMPAPPPLPPPPPMCGQTCEELSEGLQFAADALRRTEATLWQEARRDALRIGMEVAMHLVGRELQASDETLVGFIDEALQRVRESRTITLRVSRKDYDRLQKRQASFAKPVGATLELVADRTLHCGDYVIDTELCAVDGRLVQRLAAIAHALGADDRPSGGDPTDGP